MDHAIDLTDSRIQLAMKTLGIHEDELKPQYFPHRASQFLNSPDNSKNIQELRLNRHNAKIATLTHKIHEFISMNMTKIDSVSNGPSKLSLTYSANKNLTIDRIKDHFNKSLLRFVEEEKTSRVFEREIIRKSNREEIVEARLMENVEEFKKKNEKKFMNNKAKLDSISHERRIHENSVMEKINKSAASPARGKTSEKRKRLASDHERIEENDIDCRLQELNRKFVRSSENYAKNLQEKVENAQNSRKRRNSFDFSSDYNHKLKAISDRYENAVSRRQKFRQEFDEKIHVKEAKMIEKNEKMKGLFQQEIEKANDQFKSIEEKNEKVFEILVNIKQKRKNQHELKSEKNKLIEADIHLNVERLKKIQNWKKERILEKHSEIERKKKEQLEYLENKNKEIREKAMNFTIEKEKKLVFKALIAKSQSPDEVKKIMERYNKTINNHP